MAIYHLPDNDYERELELEQLTVQYMRGEIKLNEYQKKLHDYKIRLDLRKAASRLKPLSHNYLPGE
jgi:hypothetical protein